MSCRPRLLATILTFLYTRATLREPQLSAFANNRFTTNVTPNEEEVNRVTPLQFAANSHVLLVLGKGGVGRTTVASALARSAANAGLSVLLVDTEGRGDASRFFGDSQPLTWEPRKLYEGGEGTITGQTITPDDALVEWLEQHGLRTIARRLASTGALDIVATGVPGIRDLLVLGKIKQLERDRVFDLIVVDAPASGHAVSFLSSPKGLSNAALAGPIRSQADSVVEFLSDRARIEIILVTTPEETPIQETLETYEALRTQTPVHTRNVVVNQTWHAPTHLGDAIEAAALMDNHDVEPSTSHVAALSKLLEAARYRMAISAMQTKEVETLRQIDDVAILTLPWVPNDDLEYVNVLLAECFDAKLQQS